MKIKGKVKDPILQEFAREIKTLTRQKNLSQEELPDRAISHWTYITGTEQGLRNMSLKNTLRIVRALRVNPKSLLGFWGTPLITVV